MYFNLTSIYFSEWTWNSYIIFDFSNLQAQRRTPCKSVAYAWNINTLHLQLITVNSSFLKHLEVLETVIKYSEIKTSVNKNRI